MGPLVLEDSGLSDSGGAQASGASQAWRGHRSCRRRQVSCGLLTEVEVGVESVRGNGALLISVMFSLIVTNPDSLSSVCGYAHMPYICVHVHTVAHSPSFWPADTFCPDTDAGAFQLPAD